MEKPIKRLNLLAKRIGLDKKDIAMILIYLVSHDKVLAWGQTYGITSKSKNFAQMASTSFNRQKVRLFIEEVGGLVALSTELYLSMRGNPNIDLKELNRILCAVLIDPSTDMYRIDKIQHLLNYSIDHGLTVDYIDKQGKGNNRRHNDNVAGRGDGVGDKMTDGEIQDDKSEFNSPFIKLTAGMSRAEYLDFLIQEQGRTPTQKDKNAFTLKISDFMAFKNDTKTELRPTIYLCDNEHTSYLERLSSAAKGTFSE